MLYIDDFDYKSAKKGPKQTYEYIEDKNGNIVKRLKIRIRKDKGGQDLNASFDENGKLKNSKNGKNSENFQKGENSGILNTISKVEPAFMIHSEIQKSEKDIYSLNTHATELYDILFNENEENQKKLKKMKSNNFLGVLDDDYGNQNSFNQSFMSMGELPPVPEDPFKHTKRIKRRNIFRKSMAKTKLL